MVGQTLAGVKLLVVFEYLLGGHLRLDLLGWFIREIAESCLNSPRLVDRLVILLRIIT